MPPIPRHISTLSFLACQGRNEKLTNLSHHPQILNEIGGLYFSLPPPRSQGGNPMADMMSSLFGGGAPQAQPARRQLAPALPPAAITQELD